MTTQLPTYKRIINDIMEPLASRVNADLENGTTTGWEYLMSFDQCSARAYMLMHILYGLPPEPKPSARFRDPRQIPVSRRRQLDGDVRQLYRRVRSGPFGDGFRCHRFRVAPYC